MTSPFLPGTQIQFAWDSTSLGWLKTCPRLYQYSMLERWRSRDESVHLRFGLLFHSALEFYDKLRAEGVEFEDAVERVVAKVLKETWDYHENSDADGPWSSDHPKKNRETLLRTVIWYLDHFKDDPTHTIILHDGSPAVELSFKLELEQTAPDGTPYILAGHMDRLVDYGGELFVMDRKTTGSTIGPYFFTKFEPDNQMSLYTFAAKVIYNTPVQGVIIDGAQIAIGFSSFSRGMTMRSDGQLEEWLRDSLVWFKQAEGYALEGYWPQNDKACDLYGGCTFRGICKLDPAVRSHFLETSFRKDSQWNPLVSRV